MSRLHVLLPSPVAQPRDSVLSPVSTGPGLIRAGGRVAQKNQMCQATDAAGTCYGGIGW